MKFHPSRRGLLVLAVAIPAFAGCGSATDVTVADVPPVTQAPPEPQKPSPRLKKAQFSPAVLPGSEASK